MVKAQSNFICDSTVVGVLVVGLITALYWYAVRPKAFPSNGPTLWLQDHLPVVGSSRFFFDRQDMLEKARETTKTGNVGFYVGRKQVVTLGPNEGARKTFFDTKDLSFIMG